MTTQTTMKINENNTISIVDFGNGTKEIAHLENGEVSYKYMNDPIRTTYEDWQLEEQICEIAAEVIHGILEEKYEATLECDAQVILETFTYNIYVAVSIGKNNKFVYDVSTMRDEDKEKEEYLDHNQARRATFKGLLSYIEKFDR